jgi:hypothetical protein
MVRELGEENAGNEKIKNWWHLYWLDLGKMFDIANVSCIGNVRRGETKMITFGWHYFCSLIITKNYMSLDY